MNKEEFIEQLSLSLQILPAKELSDIIADYQAHFDEASANGRSEEETAKALGSPAALAQEHLLDHLEDLEAKPQEEPYAIKGFMQKIFSRGKSTQQSTEREVAWVSGTSMSIRLPIEVHWRFSTQTKAVLHGDAEMLEHIHLESEQLRGRFRWRFFKNTHICLMLESPSIEKWAVEGSASLDLYNLAQTDLLLEMAGSGDIKATGTVDYVQLSMVGSGDIDVGGLIQKRTTVKMVGTGDATIAPLEEADLTLIGNGDIKLVTKPAQLKTHKTGKGDIELADGTVI